MRKYNPLLINESSLSRVWSQVTIHDSGTISAWRYARNCGEGPIYTRNEKEEMNSKLKAQLLVKGYGVTPIQGVGYENYKTSMEREVKEDSFIVIDLNDSGKLKQDLIKLGMQYEQDAISFSKPNGEYHLISTNTCLHGYPGKGKIGVEIRLGSPFFGKKGEFFSRVNGRPFVFESVQGNTHYGLKGLSISEIRSLKHLAEEADKIQYNTCNLK